MHISVNKQKVKSLPHNMALTLTLKVIGNNCTVTVKSIESVTNGTIDLITDLFFVPPPEQLRLKPYFQSVPFLKDYYTESLVSALDKRGYNLNTFKLEVGKLNENFKLKRRLQVVGQLRCHYALDDCKLIDLFGCWALPGCCRGDTVLLFNYLDGFHSYTKTKFKELLERENINPKSFFFKIDHFKKWQQAEDQ